MKNTFEQRENAPVEAQTPAAGVSYPAPADPQESVLALAAALEGVSIEELTRKGATIYAKKLLAKRDALPLLRPAPWRQFRLENEGRAVSFRVRLPLDTFSMAIYIEQRARKENGGGYCEDSCEIAELQLHSRLSNLLSKNKKEREERVKAYEQWLDTQTDLAAQLKQIEQEVEQ